MSKPLPHAIVDGSRTEPAYGEEAALGSGSMKDTPRSITGALIVVLALSSGPLAAQEASSWAQDHRSRARLIDGGPGGAPGERLAGIEIELERGFKTYWRHPGESGLPPAFDWSGSDNAADIEVLWPAPERFEDAGGVSFGYVGGVTLPVRFNAGNEARPVRLALKLDYGVCKDICIPAQATLGLTSTVSKSSAHARRIDGALARVPKAQALGAPGDLSIVAIEPRSRDGKSVVAASARIPPDVEASLFVEAPDGWFLLPRPVPEAANSAKDGARVFLVDILERPREPSDRLELRLTLVAGERAIETVGTLDTARLPR